MELREEDLIQVLGVQHKLHVRKIIVSREKLKPLTKQEIVQKEIVEHEVSFFKIVKIYLIIILLYYIIGIS